MGDIVQKPVLYLTRPYTTKSKSLFRARYPFVFVLLRYTKREREKVIFYGVQEKIDWNKGTLEEHQKVLAHSLKIKKTIQDT